MFVQSLRQSYVARALDVAELGHLRVIVQSYPNLSVRSGGLMQLTMWHRRPCKQYITAAHEMLKLCHVHAPLIL